MSERKTGGPVSRREFVSLGVGAFALAVAPGVLQPRRRLHRRSVPVMGTVADVAVVDGDGERAHRAMDAAFGALRRVEAAMTRFDDASDVGRANLEAFRRGTRVSRETGEVVREALGWARASGGAFDPCLGAVTRLWDVKHRHEPPPPERMAALAGRGFHRMLDVEVRDGGAVLRYGDPGVALDLGGIAKGYGVDRAVEALREWGVTDAMVNVGGDLVAIGRSADGDPWEVGVRSPAAPDGIAHTLRITERAVATSGDYLSYFQHGGRRYHHLMDPESAEPTRGRVASLTVVADTCLTADAGATTAFCMPPDRSAAVLAGHRPDARVVYAE